MVKLKLIEKAIGQHCFDGWPRMVGFPRQSLYHSLEDLLKKFWLNNGSVKGVYVAIFPEPLKEYRLFNKFYFDIDKEGDIRGAHRDSAKIANFINTYFDVLPRQYFSGGKGFADYLDLNRSFGSFKDYPIVNMRLANLIREETKVNTIDSTTIGDVSQISRVPFNIHKKTKLLCIPTHTDWTFKEIMNQAMEYTGNYQIHFDRAKKGTEGWKLLRYWDETAKEYRESIRQKSKKSGFIGNMDLDLLLSKSPHLKGYRAVLTYRVIIPQLVRSGKSAEEVHIYCKEFITKSGEMYDHVWLRFVNYYIHFNINNKEWLPQSLDSLFCEYPKLLEILVK